jgi:hypothetical protein
VSNKSIVRYLVVLLFAVFTSAVLVVADLGALAQNTNSSTTSDDSMQNTNMTPTRRGRRGRRRRPATPAADASMPADTDTGAASPGEQADLSGTYTGRIRMTGGHEMDTDGTLTITGNQFTIDAGGMTHSGRVYAVTTHGYTGLSMYFSDMTDSASNTPVVAMGRARKNGDSLTISRIPGSRTSIAFGSGVGNTSRRPRRGRRGRRPAPAATEAPSDNTTPPM